METIVISSENLITNRKARDMIGQSNLVDSTKETLSIINNGLKHHSNQIGSTKSVRLISATILFQKHFSISKHIIKLEWYSFSLQANIIAGTHHKFEPVGPFDDNFEIETQDEHSNFTNGSDKSTPPPEVNANELQLNVKLFLREYNQEVASEAINYLISRLGSTTIIQF